ncbi:la-related protein 1C-like [Rutidosis leptorrhynchoides]|uniref:la-related protein 1C-like n=1 Tax=Rutidosis leptorrhynchoides TaxID=125765 RepID=UPI003A98DDEB
MTSDSSTPPDGNSSGTGTCDDGGGNSFSQRTPWSQVVRGGVEPVLTAPRSPSASPPSTLPARETKTVESQPECSEVSDSGNVSGVMKSVWSKPSVNSVAEGSITPVMGAASWPALSDATRPVPKSSSFSSESSSTDVSVVSSQAPVISQPLQKHVKSNANRQSNQNHNRPVRQKSMKRGGGAAGGHTRPPMLPPTPPPMPPYPLFDLSYRAFVPSAMDSAVPVGGGAGSHSHIVNDHPSNRKRNNYGPRPRGDGEMYVNNGHGGRHDREWRGPRSQGANVHQRAPPPPPQLRGFMHPAHMGPPPFIAPQPIRPYGAPMGYDMPPPFVYVPTIPPPESYTGPPVFPHAPPPSMYIPVMEPLSVMIQRQIEYYFSDANLVKDNYLRSNMDEEGWVPVTLIAGFRRVQSLTTDIQMILSCLTNSAVVEVQGETVRRRDDWRKWVPPFTNIDSAADSSSQSPRSAVDGSIIETSLQKLRVGELSTAENSTADPNDTHNKAGDIDISSSKFTGSLNPANEELTTGDQSMNPHSSS